MDEDSFLRGEISAVQLRRRTPEEQIEYWTLKVAQLMSERDAEKGLADDLAEVLSRTVVGWEDVLGVDLAQAPEVQRVMARYREARGR